MLEQALEESKAAEAAAQTAPTEQKEETTQDENLSEKQAEQAVDSQEFDYKAELESERKRREKAEAKLVKLKKDKKEGNDPDIESKVNELLESKLSEIEKRTQEREYERVVKAYSQGEDEAELIQYHLNNSIRLTGDTEEDVRRAKILANEKKILETQSELSHAVRSRGAIQTTPNMSGQKQKVTQEPEYTADELKLLKRFKAIK